MSGKHILLVDTEKNILFTYKNALEDEGYYVEFTDNASDALRKISKQSFSIVITEFNLQGSNALALINFIKENKPYIQVILLTARPLSMPAYEAIQDAGILDYLMKPFPITKLLIIIKKGLKRSDFILEKTRLESKFHAIKSYTLSQKQQFSDTLYFFKTLHNEIKRSERFKHSLSLLCINMPLASGDTQDCVEQIGSLALSIVRETDIATRFNGTCSIILPETSKTGVAALTERMRKKIADYVAHINNSLTINVAGDLHFTSGSFPDDIDFINHYMETLRERLNTITSEDTHHDG